MPELQFANPEFFKFLDIFFVANNSSIQDSAIVTTEKNTGITEEKLEKRKKFFSTKRKVDPWGNRIY